MKTAFIEFLIFIAAVMPLKNSSYIVSSDVNFTGSSTEIHDTVIYEEEQETAEQEIIYEETYDEEEEYLKNKYSDLSWKVIINGEVFPITTYDYDGGDLDTEESLKLWTHEYALPNYYLAEQRTSVGRAVRNLNTGDTVCLHGIDHTVIGIIYGVNNHNGTDEWLRVENEMIYHNAWGALQTCITGTYNMNVYLLN